MEEKIKISISNNTYKKLVKDSETFLFTKPNGEVNRNLFLNTIIKNYYEEFSGLEQKKRNDLLAISSKYTNAPTKMIDEILKYMTSTEAKASSLDKTILHFKPTKLSEDAIDYINDNLLIDTTLSSYYRRLFDSYASFPQYKREIIALKDVYDKILEAIESKQKVYIVLKNEEIIKEASIYTIKASTEELFNYILAEETNGSLKTIRLSKIKSIQLHKMPQSLSDKAITIFDYQIKYGVQYPLFTTDLQDVIVKFTPEGLKMFQKIYLYRPIPDRIKGNIYYFKCSHYQIIYYFKRFGKEAIVLSPKKLTQKLQKFYYNSNINYLEELDIQLETMAIEK